MKSNQINLSDTRFIYLLLAFFISPVFLQAQERLSSKSQLPIVAAFSVPAGDEATLARYQELKDAGFNYSFSVFRNYQDIETALRLGKKLGIKIVITCPELQTKTEEAVKKFMHHPALAGYFVWDEPSLKDFAKIATQVKKIKAIDSKHIAYVNIFPNYASAEQLGTDDYRTYVNKFINEVPQEFYSFDSYPMTDAYGIFVKWHKCLEIFSDEARKAGKPFWAFVQSTQFDHMHEAVSLATLRAQIYTNLAYGAQGIQYFTYWFPGNNANETFYDSPINMDGKRTAVYDKVKLMNQELKNLSGVFLGSKVISIQQTGNTIPEGTVQMITPPFPLKVLETTGEGAVVSVLENGDKRFIVIVNRDYKKSMNLTLSGDESLKKVLKDGTIVPASIYAKTIDLEPGDAAIYVYTITKKV